MNQILNNDTRSTNRIKSPSFAQQPADRVYPIFQSSKTGPKTPAQATAFLDNSEFIQSCSPIIEKHKSYTTPTAQMAATPSKKSSNPDKGKGRAVDFAPMPGSSMGRDSQDFQAQADRVEKARDRTDPDFAATSSGRKKRRVGTVQPTSPKKPKSSHQRNCPYDNLSPETRCTRDKYIQRIESNWNLPWEQWIPKSMMPKETGGGKTGIPQRLRKPQDWNNPLLEELVYLSKVTKDSHDQAVQALRDAVCRVERPKEGPLLYSTDIQSAIEALEKAEKAVTEERPALSLSTTTGPELDIGGVDPQDFLLAAAVTTALDQEPGELVNPRISSRSPTIAHEAIKSESGVKDPKKLAGGWDDWDDRREALRALHYQCKQHEAEAKANEIRYQIMLEEKALRDSRRRLGHGADNAIAVEAADDARA